MTAVQKNWALFSADVSQAFLRGKTFKELAQYPGEVLRSVQFRVPPGSVPLLRRLNGYSDFDPLQEVLDMLRPGFGLVDAPRAWSLELASSLEHMSFIATQVDPQLYNRHDKNGVLVGQVSAHVDDVKGGAEPDIEKELLA